MVALIGLLNAQQQTILNRKPIVFWRLTSPYRLRWKRAKSYKKRRQGYVSNLALNFGRPKQSSLSELLPHLPDVTQPMFESIIEEINSLISNVRQKSYQNQRLLARLLEVTDHILSVAVPNSFQNLFKQGKVGNYLHAN